MTEGAFWVSYVKSVKLLKELSLLKENNSHKDIPYSVDCKEYSRGTNYKTIHQQLVDNRDYDILLFDDSMLQMSISGGESRLLFIQNPLFFITFEQFIESSGIKANPDMIGLLHEAFDEDYFQALESMNLNSGAVYLRYDVDERGRKGNENIHAYTHLHIGLNNNIRIPVGMHLTPYAFTLFVLRHVYYDIWVNCIRKGIIKPDHKSQCEDLPEEYWTNEEKKFFYIQ